MSSWMIFCIAVPVILGWIMTVLIVFAGCCGCLIYATASSIQEGIEGDNRRQTAARMPMVNDMVSLFASKKTKFADV